MSKDFRLFGSVAGISPDTLDKIVDSSAVPYDGHVEVCDAWLNKCLKEKNYSHLEYCGRHPLFNWPGQVFS